MAAESITYTLDVVPPDEHTTLEKERRKNQRIQFGNLRDLIPTLFHPTTTKHSKRTILLSGARYIRELQIKDGVLIREREQAEARQEELVNRLWLLSDCDPVSFTTLEGLAASPPLSKKGITDDMASSSNDKRKEMVGYPRKSDLKCLVCGIKGEEDPEVSLYGFPKTIEKEREWIETIRTRSNKPDFTPTPFSRICSKHFHNGHRINGPTLLMDTLHEPVVKWRSKSKCCICGNIHIPGLVHLFNFPPKAVDRFKWEYVIGTKSNKPDFIATNSTKICSVHFQNGLRGNGPSLFLQIPSGLRRDDDEEEPMEPLAAPAASSKVKSRQIRILRKGMSPVTAAVAGEVSPAGTSQPAAATNTLTTSLITDAAIVPAAVSPQRGDGQRLHMMPPPPSPGVSVMPPSSPGVNVMPPPSLGVNVMPPSSPGVNVMPPPSPRVNVMPPPSPGVSVMPPPSPGVNVMPPPSPGLSVDVETEEPSTSALPPSPATARRTSALLVDHLPYFKSSDCAFYCPVAQCPGKFDSRRNLRRHILAHHKDTYVQYECRLCDRPFESVNHRMKHERQACGRVVERCTSCNKQLYAPKHIDAIAKPHVALYFKAMGLVDPCDQRCSTLHECCFCKMVLIGEQMMMRHIPSHRTGSTWS